jgi:hypothetical protein
MAENMKKNSKPRLTLGKEKVRELRGADLAGVAGGLVGPCPKSIPNPKTTGHCH